MQYLRSVASSARLQRTWLALLVLALLVADWTWYRAGLPALSGPFLSWAGPLAVVFGTTFAAVVLPKAKRAALYYLAAFVVAGGASASTGAMYAGCDVNMRPSIPEMVLLLFPAVLLIKWLGGLLGIATLFGLALLLENPIRRLDRKLLWLLVALTPLAGVVVYSIEVAHGAQPIPGNCVL